jgi:hypothetical protein
MYITHEGVICGILKRTWEKGNLTRAVWRTVGKGTVYSESLADLILRNSKIQ